MAFETWKNTISQILAVNLRTKSSTFQTKETDEYKKLDNNALFMYKLNIYIRCLVKDKLKISKITYNIVNTVVALKNHWPTVGIKIKSNR